MDCRRALRHARARDNLADAQLLPQLAIVNPLLWELGHVAWFQEHRVLPTARGLPTTRRGALYDSSRVPHDARWSLPLPSGAETLDHPRANEAAVLEPLARAAPDRAASAGARRLEEAARGAVGRARRP